MLDSNVLLIQITGHPIILFGEKRLNVLNRIIHHDHFFFVTTTYTHDGDMMRSPACMLSWSYD